MQAQSLLSMRLDTERWRASRPTFWHISTRTTTEGWQRIPHFQSTVTRYEHLPFFEKNKTNEKKQLGTNLRLWRCFSQGASLCVGLTCVSSLRSPGTWWRANWRWPSSTCTCSPWTPRSPWRESRSSCWMPTSESSPRTPRVNPSHSVLV